jgi:protein ImuB
VHLPALPLEAWIATLPATSPEPRALIERHRISAVDAAAAAAGVRPGMKRAAAMALAPGLRLGERAPAREAAALRAVVHAALAFTPSVVLHGDPSDGATPSGREATVLLEAAASLRLFGGGGGLVEKLRAALAPLNHRVALAAAPTALGAAWLAHGHPGQDMLPGPATPAALRRLLHGAPFTLAATAAGHAEAIAGLGVRTFGELLALPRAGLARRFGPALLEEIDRAFGLRPDPRPWQQAPPQFADRIELHMRAENAAALMAGAAVLVQRLLAWTAARQARVVAFELVLHHERDRRSADLPPARLRIELAEPSADGGHLLLLLRERLQRHALAAPVLELSLHCTELSQAAAPSGELFPDGGLGDPAVQAAGLARLLERLRERLGDEGLLRLEAVPDHRPEHAHRWRPVLAGKMPPAGPRPKPPAAASDRPLPLHRPVWLIDPPEPLAERQGQPCWRGRSLRLLSGPQRIEAGWWDVLHPGPEPGEHAVGAASPAVARDYFIAEAPDGALLWVWRQRLPQAAAPSGANWFLHGRFG